MNFLKSRSVGKKLYVCFALVIALLVLVVGMSLRGFARLPSATHGISNVARPTYNAAAQAKSDVATALAWQTQYIADRGVIVGVIAILLAAGLAFLIARAFKRPLLEVQRAAEELAVAVGQFKLEA